MIGRLLLLGVGAYAANQAYKQYRMRNAAMGSTMMDHEPATRDEAMGTVLDTDTLRDSGRMGAMSAGDTRGSAMSPDTTATAMDDDLSLGSGNNTGSGTSAAGIPTLSPERGPGPMQ